MLPRHTPATWICAALLLLHFPLFGALPHSLPRQSANSPAARSHIAMERPFPKGEPHIAQATKPALLPKPKAKSPSPTGTFASLATSGTHFLDTDREPAEFLPEIIQKQVPANADVVLLLDHTASMGDDIERIRLEFDELRKALEAKPNVRFGAVTFSDLKRKGELGYRSFPLSRDFDAVDRFLKEVLLVGSVEDVHGALVKAMDSFKWRAGAPRLLIVISDEGPALPPDSDYTAEEVLQKASTSRPATQIQPIRIKRD